MKQGERAEHSYEELSVALDKILSSGDFSKYAYIMSFRTIMFSLWLRGGRETRCPEGLLVDSETPEPMPSAG